MEKIHIGIDPGKQGMITCFTPEEGFLHYQIPIIGNFVDLFELNEIFKRIVTKSKLFGYGIHAVIEDVHAIFGSSAKNTFSFGHVLGLIEMAVVANGIPYTKVQPKKWQAEMWQGIPNQKKLSSTGKTFTNDTKLMSQLAAKRLFPGKDLRRTERSKKDDDNLIDSLLICEYSRRRFNA